MKTTAHRTDAPECAWRAKAADAACDALDETEKAAFDTHARQCSDCRETAESFRNVIQKLRDGMPAASCRDLPPDIMRRIPDSGWTPETSDAGRRRLGFPAFALRAAALVLAALAGAVLLTLRFGTKPDAVGPVAAAPSRANVIRDALQWLASVQEDSGAWAPQSWGGRQVYETALTGMALLTFLRHEDGQHPSAANAVPGGAAYLLTRQRADGGYGPAATGHMYNHGIATVALLEAYRQDLAPADAEASLKTALAFIREQQSHTGGWGYDTHPMSRPNTSISVWQMEALALGLALGWTEAGEPLERGLAWLATMANEQGQFGYRQADDTADHAALTAMGAYCLFKAAGKTPDDPAGRALVRRALHRVATESEEGNLDYYRSYFIASALKTSAEPEHRQSLTRLRSRLTREQSQDPLLAGSWNPADQWSAVGGRLYATTLAAMMLENRPGMDP